MKVEKPSYATSRQAMWISSALAWGVIFAVVIGAIRGSDQAASVAGVAIPSMCMLIAGMLGIHRHYGSRDMETIASQNIAETVVTGEPQP